MRPWIIVLAASVALAGCSSDPDKQDNDRDGFVGAEDCDDNEPTIRPGAEEVCDGVDNNCDGQIDENSGSPYYADVDNDGFGDKDTIERFCTAPEADWAPTPGDCDDTDASIHPEADERCDEVDHNCDGDPTLNATDRTDWYLDGDGDGYGGGTSITACDAPGTVYIATTGDCDDDDDQVNPGATEHCNGGVDDDCDPLTLEEEMAADRTTFYADTDHDGYGDDAQTTLACDAPPNTTAQGGDCDDAEVAMNPGAAEICNGGVDDDCDPSTDEDTLLGTEWYPDGDGDTFGNEGALAVVQCDAPANHVGNNGDCDDGDPAISPDADELCGGVDENCDGLQDDGAADAVSYYEDLDGDTYGGVEIARSCSQPPGTITTGGDCNDGDPLIHPGATEECNGGVDDDCDPSTDEGATSVWYRDADGDGYGDDADTVPACSPVYGYVAVGGDCDDTDASVNPGVHAECIYEHCGDITKGEFWDSAYVHVVTCDVNIGGPLQPVVTVEDGATVFFDAGTTMRVGDQALGALAVDGLLDGVVFTSSEQSPSVGDWQELYLGANDTGSSLLGLTLEFSGGGGEGGLVIDGADPVIQESMFTDNLNDGLHIISGTALIMDSVFRQNTNDGVEIEASGALDRGGPGVESFDNNTLTANGGRPIALPASSLDELSLSSDFTGNVSDVIEVTAGTAEVDGVWHDHGVVYRVSGDVKVEGPTSPSITVEDGVTMRFNAGKGLTAGVADAGAITTQGSTTFTTANGNPTPGAWQGLTFGPNDAGSALSGALIEYAGGNGKGAVFADHSQPTLLNTTIQWSSKAGLYGATATPSITGSTFVDNLEEGIYLDANSLLGADFLNNVLARNQETSITLPARTAERLDASSAYTGNVVDTVTLLGGGVAGLIESDKTWQLLDTEFRVDGDINVQGPTQPQLTLQDGIVVHYMPNAGLTIGDGERGRLEVQGSPGTGVTFTSAQAAPAPGDWDGLKIGSNDQDSQLAYLTIEYGGGNSKGGLYVVGANLVVNQVTSSNNLYAGLRGESCNVEIYGSTFSNNTDEGVNLNASSTLEPGAGVRTFRDNTITGNTTWPVVVDITSLDELDPSTTYGGNGVDRVRLLGNTNAFDARMAKLNDADYELAVGDWLIEGPLQPIVDIDAGVQLFVQGGLGVQVGGGDFGRLQIHGTPAEGVRFTSANPLPNPGDWDGVKVASQDTGSVFSYLTVEYAGGNNKGGIWSVDSSPVITGGTLAYNKDAGFYGDGSTAELDGVSVHDNTGDGLYFDKDSAPPTIQNNTITANLGSSLVIPASWAGDLDTSTDYVGNGVDEVVLLADTIDFPVVWRDLGVPYRVDDAATILVQGSAVATLLVEDGVTVSFGSSAELRVADTAEGLLTIDGPSQGVLFTSRYSNPQRGDWDGLTLGPLDAGSQIEGLTIEYAGANGRANLYLDGASAQLTSVLSRFSTTSGLYITGGAEPAITDSEFSFNDERGVDITNTGGLSHINQPSFQRNDTHNNDFNGIRLPSEAVGQIEGSTCSFTGNGLIPELIGGAVSTTQVWTATDEPWLVSGSVDVKGPTNPQLTISDGLTYYFEPNTVLKAGRTDGGSLIIAGGAQRVFMTSAQAIQAEGDWQGIEIGQMSQTSAITGLDIEFAGGNNVGVGANIEVTNTNLTLTDVTSAYGSKFGVSVIGTVNYPASITVYDTTLHDNLDGAIYSNPEGRLLDVVNLVAYNNGVTSFSIPAESLDALQNATWQGRIELTGGSFDTPITWPTSNGYLITGDLTVNAPVVIPDGEYLELLGVGISVSKTVNASLVANNVVFTSAQAFPLAGDWKGLEFYAGCQGSSLDGVEVSYGGGNGKGNVYTDSCDFVFANALITNSSSFGIASKGFGSAGPPLWDAASVQFSNNFQDVDLQ